MQFTTNQAGHTVKVTAPKTMTDAPLRFAARLIERQQPEGFSGPCQVFQGTVFRVSESEIIKPARYALRLRGIEPSSGTRLKPQCQTPNCVAHLL